MYSSDTVESLEWYNTVLFHFLGDKTAQYSASKKTFLTVVCVLIRYSNSVILNMSGK